MSKTTSNKRWMVQSLLRMAEITEDEVKRSRYLQEAEEIFAEIREMEEIFTHNREVSKGSVEFFCDINGGTGGSNFVKKQLNDVYKDYVNFCKNDGYRITPKNEFSKRLQAYLPISSHRINLKNGSKVTIYVADEE